jgi:hypothetical protein
MDHPTNHTHNKYSDFEVSGFEVVGELALASKHFRTYLVLTITTNEFDQSGQEFILPAFISNILVKVEVKPETDKTDDKTIQ